MLTAAYEGRNWWWFDNYRAWAQAALDRRSDKLQEASALLVEVTQRLTDMGAWAYLAFPLLDLVEVAAEGNDTETARSAADTMKAVARHADRPLHAALDTLTAAWLALVSHDPDRAAPMARQAAAALEDTGCRALSGRALDCLGHALARDDRSAAVDAFERAVIQFEASGASWRRDRTLQSMRTLGARGRRLAATHGSDELTNREEEIVQLSTQGYTAKEIGQRLFISKRTVETHLAHAYAKLGVRNKRELVQRSSSQPATTPTGTAGRILATVLFTDIVASTRRAAEMGDARWRALLDRHDRIADREISRFRGHKVKSLGDGLLATFDAPARAVRCALSIGHHVAELGIEVRAGIHTGELEISEADVSGLAVHIGSRVCGLAGPGEVLVTRTVQDLVSGSGLQFTDRGIRALRDVPGEWHLAAAHRS